MYCDVFCLEFKLLFEQCLYNVPIANNVCSSCWHVWNKYSLFVCLFVHDCFAIFTSSSFLLHAWSFGSCYELSFSTLIVNLPLHVISSSSPWHNVMNWDLSRILTMFCVVCNHLSRHPCFPLPLHVLAWVPTHFKI